MTLIFIMLLGMLLAVFSTRAYYNSKDHMFTSPLLMIFSLACFAIVATQLYRINYHVAKCEYELPRYQGCVLIAVPKETVTNRNE
jgi:hypothetical protein